MKIGGIVENCELILYRVTGIKDLPGMAGSVLSQLATKEINLEYITECGIEDEYAVISFCTAKEDEDKVDAFIEEQRGLQTNLRLIKEPDVAIFGIYGPHFREKHSIAANLFYLLGQAGINILGVSSSISSVCCIISAQDVDQARQLVGDHYDLP